MARHRSRMPVWCIGAVPAAGTSVPSSPGNLGLDWDRAPAFPAKLIDRGRRRREVVVAAGPASPGAGLPCGRSNVLLKDCDRGLTVPCRARTERERERDRERVEPQITRAQNTNRSIHATIGSIARVVRVVRGWWEGGTRVVRACCERGTRMVRGWYEGGTRVFGTHLTTIVARSARPLASTSARNRSATSRSAMIAIH